MKRTCVRCSSERSRLPYCNIEAIPEGFFDATLALNSLYVSHSARAQ